MKPRRHALAALYLLAFLGLIATGCNGQAPFGDYDSDGDVDQVDFGHMQTCLSTPPDEMDPACAEFDRNSDGAVDDYDVDAFDACASGSEIPANPACRRWPSLVASDDFNSFNLDPGLWSIGDPRGDCTFDLVGTNTADARLRIDMPGGSPHSIWTYGIKSPHVMQAANDTDMELEVRFLSAVTEAYHEQGLLIQEDDDTFMRFDLYSDGADTWLYAATFDGGVVSQKTNQVVSPQPPFLRVDRTGDNWTFSHSTDGSIWTTGVQFTHTLVVTRVGLFAGNEKQGDDPPFTCEIDYFFNNGERIVPEDGATVQDTLAPNLYHIETATENSSVVLRWSTDEPATSRIDYGQTAAYELGTITDPSPVTEHYARIDGLTPALAHHFRLASTDAAGHESVSDDIEITVSSPAAGPDIDVWYGTEQTFGSLGMPQPAVNILGNASDDDGVDWMGYYLNHAFGRLLSLGPDDYRLAEPGDFNADILYGDLLPGTNDVLLRGMDLLGNVHLKVVGINNASGPIWPLPYAIDWSQVSAIGDVAQVVDGQWIIEGDTVRCVVMDYDRLIAIGDLTWQDYEATVPITVHATDPYGYDPPSYGPAVGILCRWIGHSDDGSQPLQGIYPLGGIGLYRWQAAGDRYQIFGNNGFILAQAPLSDVLTLGVTYIFKVRVETVGFDAVYRLKVWPAGDPEPPTWKLVGSQQLVDDPQVGSMLLLAHHVDASFGDVTIVPGPFP